MFSYICDVMQVLFLLPVLSFSSPDVLCDTTNFIWREGTPFEVMTSRTVSIDGLLAEVFLSSKENSRRYVYSPRYHLIITLIIS